MGWRGFRDIQATIIIDLSDSEEEILKRADRSRRKNIKKAMQENLKFVEAKNEEDWKEWYKIYKKVWTEGGIDYQKLEIFRKLNHKLFLIKKDNKILAGGVFEELRDKIIFKAFASLIEYQDLRLNDFLYWNSILYAKKAGKKEVDLGGWQIKARGHLIGVNEFKEKWGGKIIYYYIYSKNPFYIVGRKAIRNSRIARWIWDRLKRRPVPKRRENKFEDRNKQTYESGKSVNFFSSLDNIHEVEKKIIEKYFFGKILDLGCGCGRTTKYLFEKGYDVTGVELAENMVKEAKRKFPEIKFEVGDACNLKFPDESFDIVFFSAQGLDYIFPEGKRVKALEEISRVLKRRGYFIYSSHNPKKLISKFRPLFFLRNLVRGSLFSKFKNEKQIWGETQVYYGSPEKQKDLVEKNTDLRLIEKASRIKKDLHPHYIFKKI